MRPGGELRLAALRVSAAGQLIDVPVGPVASVGENTGASAASTSSDDRSSGDSGSRDRVIDVESW